MQKNLSINTGSTILELSKYYLENNIKNFYTISTYEAYKVKLEKHVVPVIGSIKLNKLRKIDIQNNVYKLMDNKELSSNSIRIVYSILHKMLNFAIEFELMDKNVSDGIKLPKKDIFTPTILNRNQVNKLILCSQGNILYVPIILAVEMGLRRSEILSLKWCDVDFKNEILSINKNNNGLKTSQSERKSKIPKIVKDVLISYKTEQKNIFSKNDIVQGENMLVVCKNNGEPYNPTFISKKFSELISKNNLTKARFHDLRHTYATQAHNDGMPIKHLSKSLGHNSAVTTIENYVHINEKYYG